MHHHNNVLQLLENKTSDYQNRVALGIRTAFGWKEFTYRGIGLLSRKLASYLINETGLKKGEKVAILSESKPEYGACVFAAVLAGATTVPLDIKLTSYELNSILSDCLPSVVLVSQGYLEMALKLKDEIASIKNIIVIDEPSYNMELPCLYTLPNVYEAKWRHRSGKSTAFIIYTSGTTGAPKGVEISFNNMLSQLSDMSLLYSSFFPEEQHISVLSILPMNHLFELTVGFSTFLHWGLSVYYTQSLKPKDILEIMRAKNVNFMIVVPAFLKLLKTGIETEINNSNIFVRVMFKALYAFAKIVPSYDMRKMLFQKIHDKFGGSFNGCISGGAPLDLSVGEFFERIGIKVYQGYGLTETSPVVSVNYDKRNVMASVGRPLSSFEAKIDETTGEILLRGPSVMKGYHNQPELTAETIDKDGWLHTGDIGHIDTDGHLYITGRIKNMIVLSGGKKVFPEEVEAVLEKSPNFAEVCVFGSNKSGGAKDGTEDIVAVVVPSEDFKNKASSVDELNTLVREEVKLISNQLAFYKRPINIVVLETPLPRTTTRKVKRQEVKKLVEV